MSDDIIGARTAEELYAACHAIDQATAEQLDEIADSFAMSNNRETARELKDLAAWKSGHVPAGGSSSNHWFVVDPGDPFALHYMMRPWHVVRIAIANEDRMAAALKARAARPTDTVLRTAVDRLLERQHARIADLERRLAGLPLPEDDWDEDPDPPHFDQ